MGQLISRLSSIEVPQFVNALRLEPFLVRVVAASAAGSGSMRPNPLMAENMSRVDFDELEHALATYEHTADAAEVHGTLCGLLAAIGGAAEAIFVPQTMGEQADDGPASQRLFDVLQKLAQETFADIAGDEFGLQVLVPDDQAVLADRLTAVAAWSQGFLHGIGAGLATIKQNEQLEQEPLAELVGDLVAISQVETEGLEPSNAAEQELTELLEYLRVAAQLAFESLAPIHPMGTAPDQSVH